MACRQRELAVRIIDEAAKHCTDLYVQVALLSLGGLVHLSSPAAIPAARNLLQEAHSAFGGNPHPPAELFLLEAQLHMATDGPAMALEAVRSARESVPVFDGTARKAEELEGEVFSAMGRSRVK